MSAISKIRFGYPKSTLLIIANSTSQRAGHVQVLIRRGRVW
jgi:hypothetical protein